MANENSKKFLCLEVFKCLKSETGNIMPTSPVRELCKCPASPEMLMAALQFLTDDMVIRISVSDKPIDFSTSEVDK